MRGKSARDLTEAEVRDIAVRYLTRREYGVRELGEKLVQRGAAVSVAEEVVNELAEENLVSDQRFTEMYVRMRIRRLFGPLKIRAELRGRGVPGHVVDAAMPDGNETWFDTASQWAAKKYRGELDYASRAKIYRSLMNRGFTHEQANTGIDRLNSRD